MPYARNLLLAALASIPLAACSSGNIRTAGSYSAPAAPQVQKYPSGEGRGCWAPRLGGGYRF